METCFQGAYQDFCSLPAILDWRAVVTKPGKMEGGNKTTSVFH